MKMTGIKEYNGIIEVSYRRRGDVIIRSMQEDDIENVMQIWLETNIQTHSYIDESYWKSQYDNVRQLLPESEVYVCEILGQITGFIGLSGNYIAGLFVALQFRSQGIGKKLLDYVKEIKPELYLTVYQKNHRAVRFYRREGFETESETIDENTGEKEFLMKRVSGNLKAEI